MKSAINIGQQFWRNFRYGVGVGQVAHSTFAVPSVVKTQIIQQPSGFVFGHRCGTPAPIPDPFVLSAKNPKASARQTQEVTTERVPRLRSSLAPLDINLVADLHSGHAASVDSVFVIRRQTNYYAHVEPSFACGVSCASTWDDRPAGWHGHLYGIYILEYLASYKFLSPPLFRTLRLVLSAIGLRFSRPVAATAILLKFPPGSSQRCTGFAIEDEGLDALIAEFLSDSSCRRVKRGASVLCPICYQPCNFQNLPLVRHSRCRTAY